MSVRTTPKKLLHAQAVETTVISRMFGVLLTTLSPIPRVGVML